MKYKIFILSILGLMQTTMSLGQIVTPQKVSPLPQKGTLLYKQLYGHNQFDPKESSLPPVKTFNVNDPGSLAIGTIKVIENIDLTGGSTDILLPYQEKGLSLYDKYQPKTPFINNLLSGTNELKLKPTDPKSTYEASISLKTTDPKALQLLYTNPSIKETTYLYQNKLVNLLKDTLKQVYPGGKPGQKSTKRADWVVQANGNVKINPIKKKTSQQWSKQNLYVTLNLKLDYTTFTIDSVDLYYVQGIDFYQTGKGLVTQWLPMKIAISNERLKSSGALEIQTQLLEDITKSNG